MITGTIDVEPIGPAAVMVLVMLKELPDNDRPVPLVYVPAPENCVKVNAVDPRVTVGFVNTHPEEALIEPCSTNVNNPDVTLADVLASVALVGAPEAFTV